MKTSDLLISDYRKLFFSNCKHIDDYNNNLDFNWQSCNGCKLRDFELDSKDGEKIKTNADVCFLIWHEDILNDGKKVYVCNRNKPVEIKTIQELYGIKNKIVNYYEKL